MHLTSTDIVGAGLKAGTGIIARMRQTFKKLQVYRDLGDHRDEALKYKDKQRTEETSLCALVAPGQRQCSSMDPCSPGASWEVAKDLTWHENSSRHGTL